VLGYRPIVGANVMVIKIAVRKKSGLVGLAEHSVQAVLCRKSKRQRARS
jgi:hypothetical protein